MKPLLINRKVTLIFAVIGFLLLLLGALMKINHWGLNAYINGSTFLSLGIIFHGIAWSVVLYDLIVNPVRNKIMWFIGLFFIHQITVIFYLINREKHLERDFNPNFNN